MIKQQSDVLSYLIFSVCNDNTAGVSQYFNEFIRAKFQTMLKYSIIKAFKMSTRLEGN